MKAMVRDPEDRYASAAELADEVEHWLADEPVAAFAEPWITRAWRWVRNHQSQVVSGGVAALIAFISLFVALGVVSRSYQEVTRANAKLTEANQSVRAAQHALRDSFKTILPK